MTSNVKPLRLNVAINKEKTKVLFAEANNEFVDVLLSFLALPLGKMVSIMNDGKTAGVGIGIGSLNSLYASLSKLEGRYFSWKGAKQMLLNPCSASGAECRKLAVDITDSPKIYYVCSDLCNSFRGLHNRFSMYPHIGTCRCGKPLNTKLSTFRESPGGGAGGFTTDLSFFIITDDLCVAPIVGGFSHALNYQNRYTYFDTQGVEMRSISFGIHEIKVLLKLALTSATPLTDMVIKKSHANASASATTISPKAELLSSWYHHIPKEIAHSRKIVLKVSLQKSTNKFLFAEATAEFVELLFSFLSVSLGGVEFLLGGNTSALKSIDNIYRSVTYGIDNKYFKTRKSKEMLLNPKLPYGYTCKNQLLPLSEEEAPTKRLYHFRNYYREKPQNFGDWAALVNNGKANMSIKLNKELYVKKLYHVKKETMYIVSDDLSVSPSLLATGFSIIARLGIPLSDVKQMVLPVGLEEALRILKASLTSKTAITDGLMLCKTS